MSHSHEASLETLPKMTSELHLAEVIVCVFEIDKGCFTGRITGDCKHVSHSLNKILPAALNLHLQ